jgi:hypothetical protein
MIKGGVLSQQITSGTNFLLNQKDVDLDLVNKKNSGVFNYRAASSGGWCPSRHSRRTSWVERRKIFRTTNPQLVIIGYVWSNAVCASGRGREVKVLRSKPTSQIMPHSDTTNLLNCIIARLKVFG